MNVVRLHCDEDVPGSIWRGIRRLGIEVSSVVEESQFGFTDLALLEWAHVYRRVLLTFNVQDFPRIHAAVLTEFEHHAGIIVAVRSLPVGEVIRRARRLCASLSAEEMYDRLEYLSTWG